MSDTTRIRSQSSAWWMLCVVVLVLVSVPAVSAVHDDELPLPVESGDRLQSTLWMVANKDSTGAPAPVTIELSGKYDTAAGMVNLRAVICTYTELSDSCMITVAVVEEDSHHPTGEAPDKEFIVRQVETEQYGEFLNEGVIAENSCVMKQYAIQLDRAWDAGSWSIAVFIHTPATTEAAHVVQAARIAIADM